MRVAIITDTFLPAINGVVTSIQVFRDELERQGHQVFVFAPRYSHSKETDERVFRFPSIPFPFSLMREQRIVFPSLRVFRQLARLRVDVIHSQVPSFSGAWAVLLSRLLRIPHLHTYHTHWMEYTHYMPLPRWMSRRAVQWISQHYCGRCQLVLSPSDGMREALIQMGVDAPIRVLPTGIHLPSARSIKSPDELRRTYPIPPPERLEGKRILSYVGRVGREKNLRFLMHMLTVLLERRDDLHFLLVGDGPDRTDLDRDIEALHLSEHVTMTGYIDHEDVPGIFAMTDVFVTSSLTETQGLVLLESMAVGTPVVAVAAMGVRDMLEDGKGGMLSGHDEHEFARCVETLLDDHNRRRRASEEAVQKAEEWSVPSMTRRLVASYRESVRDFRRFGRPRFRHRAGTVFQEYDKRQPSLRHTPAP